MCWIYDQIDFLSTPCGKIVVKDERGQTCKFSVKKNSYSPDYTMFYGTVHAKVLNTDTNYSLYINIAALELGHTYIIRLEGSELHYGDSDEHTVCVSGTSNGYSIAIGAYDPNDDEKNYQAYENGVKQGMEHMIIDLSEYDESRFEEYDVNMLDDCSGFSFRLIDHSKDWIVFSVAWVKNKYYAEECESAVEYESAVEFWTT